LSLSPAGAGRLERRVEANEERIVYAVAIARWYVPYDPNLHSPHLKGTFWRAARRMHGSVCQGAGFLPARHPVPKAGKDVTGAGTETAVTIRERRGGMMHRMRHSWVFAAQVGDEFEVDRLAVALGTTLERTIQPASASIWLRSGGGAATAGQGSSR
jgi:hypothetical protein